MYVVACAWLIWAGQSSAQELEFSVSPSPVGSGARAAGMADAFVAVADDATAASWNPAGLVQLERPELSVVGAWDILSETFEDSAFDPESSNHGSSRLTLNYLSIAYPLPFRILNRNACLSLSYQRKYDFSRSLTYESDRFTTGGAGTPWTTRTGTRFDQSGSLSAITLAYAMEVTGRLSVGGAVNIWRSSFLGDNGWTQDIEWNTQSRFGSSVTNIELARHEEYKDFSGENFTFGVLWNASRRVTLGARYATAFTGRADYSAMDTRTYWPSPSVNMPGAVPSITVSEQRERRRIHFPASIAVGAAYHANERLTLSFDVTRTDWSSFYAEDAQGKRFSLVDASNVGGSASRSHFDPTYTIRLGAEYVFKPQHIEEGMRYLWSLRGGLFYDQEPASGKSNADRLYGGRGSGSPDSFYGFSLGAGLLAHRRINFDFAYQLRYGPGVNGDFIQGVEGFDEDVLQHRFLFSTVLYF